MGGSDGLREPVESLEKTVTSDGTRGLDLPGSIANGMEAKLIRDLGACECAWQVLLVGEDEEHGVAQLWLGEHLVELLAVVFNTLSIIGVDDEDEALGVVVVVSPETSELVLTTDIPHFEADLLVLNRLNVKANSGDRVYDLTKLKLVEDGGLASGVETNHEDSHLALFAELTEMTEKGAHCSALVLD